MRHSPRTRRAGFTLLELLVAIAVFALMAAMAYGGLNSVMRQSEIVDGEADRLADFQQGLQRLRDDLTLAIDRPVRDSQGSPLPAFVGDDRDGTILAFARLGAENPWLAAQGQIERVEWRLDDGRLQRRAAVPADGAAIADRADWRTWLSVERLEARFYDGDDRAHPQWPPANRPQAGLPRAVELVLIPRQSPPLRMTVALVGDWPESAPGRTTAGDETGSEETDVATNDGEDRE